MSATTTGAAAIGGTGATVIATHQSSVVVGRGQWKVRKDRKAFYIVHSTTESVFTRLFISPL